MGNSDIRDIAHIEEVYRPEISGYDVAIDASNWLYKYMTTTTRFTNKEAYTNGNNKQLPNLIGVPSGVRKLINNNIRPVFVFDGKPHSLKRQEIERRKQKRSKASKKAEEAKDYSVEESKYESRSQQLNDDIIETTKKLLDILDIPHITAPQAAESQGAYMTQSDDFDSLISDDYDSLIFGSQKTIRKFTKSSDTVEIMSLSETLKYNDMSQKQIVLATILCGTDYNDGVSGIGPKTATDIVTDNKTVEDVLNHIDKDIPDIEEILELYTEPKVKDDWPSTRVSNPDVEEAREYLKQQDMSLSKVEKPLKEIEENSSQTGISSF